MEMFAKFKEQLQKAVHALRGPGNTAEEILKAVETADNWSELETKLLDLRTVSRRRQQEVFERLEPMAARVEELLAESKKTRIKVMRNNLLRQAEGYMEQLEAEDKPAEIHSATARMLTNILKQVQRAAAMQESTITAEAIDAIAARMEDIVEVYAEASEAARDLGQFDRVQSPAAPSVEHIEKRLSNLFTTEDEPGLTDSEPMPEETTSALEKRLYDV